MTSNGQEAPGGHTDEEPSSAGSHHTARDATLGTIKEEAEVSRVPPLTPDTIRSVKKAPSLRGSAKFSRKKLSETQAQQFLITQAAEESCAASEFQDDDADQLDFHIKGMPESYDDVPIQDDPADHSFDRDNDLDDEYDTDLEMDMEEWLLEGRSQLQGDMTGHKTYVAACEAAKVTAATYFIKHLEDKEVVMRHHGLGPVGTKALCQPMKNNSRVEKLDLEGNWIQQPGCDSVADMLTENIYLSDLILSENKIGSDGAVSLCQILCKNDMISKLDLSGNDLKDNAAEALCDMLKKNTTLKHLIVRHNYFEEDGAHSFKDALSTNESLETMDLSWNRFRTKSAMLIAEGIQENYGLRCLNFAMNGLGLDGAESMGRALKTNRTLLQLDISFNRIPERGAGFIAVGLQTNDVLQGIKISSNPIGSEGALVLLLALDRNDSSCLNYMEMMNIRVHEEFRALEQKLKDERDLVVIHAGYNLQAGTNELKPQLEPDDWWIRDPMTKLRKYVKESGYRLVDLFRDFDKDGNNTISREEFVIGVQQAGIHMSEENIDELIRRMDKDKNGTIEYTELMEGDKEYRMLRRQWAEQKAKDAKELGVLTPKSAHEDKSVRDMLSTKEALASARRESSVVAVDAGTSTG